MATLQIPDRLYTHLKAEAERLGWAEDDVVTTALQSFLDQDAFETSDLTEAQIERLKHGVAQIRAGNVVSSEDVDVFFAEWNEELDAR